MKNSILKSILFSLAFLVSFGFAQAGNGPQGKVVDAANHEGISNAKLYIPSLQTGILADENGSFALPTLQPGMYWVEISGTGYKVSKIRLNVSGKDSETFQFSLETDTWSMENYTLNSWEFDPAAHILPSVTISAERGSVKSRSQVEAAAENSGNSVIQAGENHLLQNLFRSISKLL